MKNLFLIATILAGLSVAQTSFAQQTAPLPDPSAEDTSKDHDTTEMHTTGLSVGDGSFQGNHQGSVGAQGMETSITNSPSALNTYVTGHTSFDLGLAPGQQGFAIDMEEKSGINLWTRTGDTPIVPLIGLEPLNFMLGTSIGFNQSSGLDLNRIPGHEPYFEWSPMASVGFQLLDDTCKAMFAVRGGASFGTLGDGGVRGAYGASVSGLCKKIFSFSADIMRIPTKTIDVDMASVRAFVLFPGQHFGLGAVLDARDSKNVSQASPFYGLPLPPSPTGEFVGKVVIGGDF